MRRFLPKPFIASSMSLCRRSVHNAQNAHHRLAIDPKPFVLNRGLTKVGVGICCCFKILFLQIVLIAVASMYVGGKIAQKAATFLEENEIFVHAEDDEDD